jgi:hypothetical protein
MGHQTYQDPCPRSDSCVQPEKQIIGTNIAKELQCWIDATYRKRASHSVAGLGNLLIVKLIYSSLNSGRSDIACWHIRDRTGVMCVYRIGQVSRKVGVERIVLQVSDVSFEMRM